MRSLIMKFLFTYLESNKIFSAHIFLMLLLSSLGINYYLNKHVSVIWHIHLRLFMENICPSLTLPWKHQKNQSNQRIVSSGNQEWFPGLHLTCQLWIKRSVQPTFPFYQPRATLSTGLKQTPSKQQVKYTEQNMMTAGTQWGLTVQEILCNLTVQTLS